MDARPQPHPLPSLAPLLPVLPRLLVRFSPLLWPHSLRSQCLRGTPPPAPAVLRLVRSGFPWSFAVTAQTAPHGGRFRPPHLRRRPSLPAPCCIYARLGLFSSTSVCFCGDVHLSPRMCPRRGRAAAVLSVPVRAQLAAETNEREDPAARSPAQIRSGCAVGARNRRCLWGWG